MADKYADSLQRVIGRELCLVRRDGKRKGYRKDILTDNLSERDAVFICNRCQGMMREVCISTDGGQFCSCCKEENEQANPNIQMDNMILSFKCSCPLMVRGCGWLGTLGNCEDHLDTCGYVYETCELRCGVVLQRNELRIHVTDTCVQRLIQCEHCTEDFKFCDMSAHLDVCPKMEVSCELKCGIVMCREVMTQHLEVDCPEKAIECPYAKYKCVGLIKRKDMSKHLEERRIEHLELKFIATIEIMSQKIESLEKEVDYLNSNPIKLDWIAKVPKYGCHAKKQFPIAGYQFEFVFHRHSYYNPIQISIYPQNGCYYERLKWPFKGEFTTRLRFMRNPTVTKEFKSEAIVVEREDFNSDSEKYFNIVSISYNEYIASEYLTDVAEFEIYVIFINEAS